MFKSNKSSYRVLSNLSSLAAQVVFAGFVTGLVVLPLDIRKLLVIIFELISSILLGYMFIEFGIKGKL